MEVSNQNIEVTQESLFSEENVSLFSQIKTISSEFINDQAKLNELIQSNESLCASIGESREGSSATSLRIAYKPLVVVGPSGAGKGTLIGKLTSKYEKKFGFSVSFTTRPPRANEINGVHYYFVEKEEFQKKIENDEFIEYCNVHTNFYGTEKQQIRNFSENKIIPLLDIDIQGAKKVYKAFPDTNFIFICPPSISSLKERIMKRGLDNEDQLKIRLKNAEVEIKECLEFDKVIKFRIVNDNLDVATNQFMSIVEALYSEELTQKEDKLE